MFTAKNESPGLKLWMLLRAHLEEAGLPRHFIAHHERVMLLKFAELLSDRRFKVLEPLIVPATATTNERHLIAIRKDFRDAFALAAFEFVKVDGVRRFHVSIPSMNCH